MRLCHVVANERHIHHQHKAVVIGFIAHAHRLVFAVGRNHPVTFVLEGRMVLYGIRQNVLDEHLLLRLAADKVGGFAWLFSGFPEGRFRKADVAVARYKRKLELVDSLDVEGDTLVQVIYFNYLVHNLFAVGIDCNDAWVAAVRAFFQSEYKLDGFILSAQLESGIAWMVGAYCIADGEPVAPCESAVDFHAALDIVAQRVDWFVAFDQIARLCLCERCRKAKQDNA